MKTKTTYSLKWSIDYANQRGHQFFSQITNNSADELARVKWIEVLFDTAYAALA